tara:strand:+ start:295 stop:426 length:132 start_codon:yes stop_codon:yes gene_type:complete
MKIEELISSVNSEQMAMPEFQREFVWNEARNLVFKSLAKDTVF